MKLKLIAALVLIVAAALIGGWKWTKGSPTRSAAPPAWAKSGPTISPSGWSWGEDAE